MPKLKIDGIVAYNGEYEIDLNLNNRDLHTIKEISGVRGGEVQEALEAGDSDVIVALAVNALRRAGHIVNMDALWDAGIGMITVIDDVEDDAAPPQTPSVEPEQKPSEPQSSSGVSGNGTGGHPGSDPSSTGIPDSATGAVFDRVISPS